MRHILFLLLAALALTACHPTNTPRLMHPSKIRYELADSVVIPMRIEDGRILLDAKIDGHGPFPFIFDTGAHGSVMDLGLAREQGLTLGQEVRVGSPGGGGLPGNQVILETLQIGGLTLKDVSCIAFEGMPFPKTADAPRGILSPYGLSGLLITLDYPANQVVFRRGALPAPDEREIFGWDRTRGLPQIPTTIAGLPFVVHLDSGASVSLSVPTDLANRLPLAGPLVDMGFAKTVDRVIPVRGAQLDGDFKIGRYTWSNPTLRVTDLAKGVGNVGAALMSQFAITLDPENSRLRLEGPADGQLVVTESRKPRYGVQFHGIEASPLEVASVDAGSPAEKTGLRGGDRIVRMNDRPIEEVSVDDRLTALKTSPLRVTIQRGDETVSLNMALE